MDKARMKEALKAFIDAGAEPRAAAIVVAISTNESNNTFGVPRSANSVLPISCYTSRQILRPERGRGGSDVLPKTWTSDTQLMAWLDGRGYLSADKKSLSGKAIAYDKLEGPNNDAASIFEYLIDQRKLDALRIFSVGPTQMFLEYSPALHSESPMATRFATLDELFAFYTARTVRDLWGPWFGYLRTDVKFYPTPSFKCARVAGPLDAVETYLHNYQTGGVNFGQDIWMQYADSFLTSVKVTWQLAAELGIKLQ